MRPKKQQEIGTFVFTDIKTVLWLIQTAYSSFLAVFFHTEILWSYT